MCNKVKFFPSVEFWKSENWNFTNTAFIQPRFNCRYLSWLELVTSCRLISQWLIMFMTNILSFIYFRQYVCGCTAKRTDKTIFFTMPGPLQLFFVTQRERSCSERRLPTSSTEYRLLATIAQDREKRGRWLSCNSRFNLHFINQNCKRCW